ncbi:MAG: tripartite tricarboxylate transporter substrate binding protein [Candidatus Methylomirabilota bacterium]
MKTHRSRSTVWTLAMLAIGMAFAGAAQAAYPQKPIQFVVPWAPGGASGVMAQTMAKPLSEELKQPVVVVYKPGATGVTGTLELEKSAPDGYTIATYSISQALTQYTSPNPTSLANVVPIAEVMTSSATLSVNANQPFKTLKEFIDYAKANPKKIRNGNSGKGGSNHIFAEAFDAAAGTQQTHVPFAGAGPAITAIAGGHLEAVCIPVGDLQPMARAGKIRILAVAADERHHQLSDIPTMRELGVNLVIDNWVGIVAPKGTPPEIVDILDKAIKRSLERPDTIKAFNSIGNIVLYRNSKTFAEWLKGHDAQIRTLTENLGLRATPKK